MTGAWTDERLAEGWLSRYAVNAVAADRRSSYQHIHIVDSVAFGKMLLLDGVVQTTERDEFIYHEMMTHLPMLVHGSAKTLLIIGGGDGGILREALKHPTVESATLVEIDGEVVELCRKHLPEISAGAFDDSRTELIIGDGVSFMEKTSRTFDLVIVDSCDPVGPAAALFSAEFYRSVKANLRANGVFVCQTGSTFLQPEVQRNTVRRLQDVYAAAGLYVYDVPTYIGGLFSSCMACSGRESLDLGVEALRKRYTHIGLQTSYYNPEIHVASFVLPEYVRENL